MIDMEEEMDENANITTNQGITGVGVQNIGVSGSSEVNGADASSVEVPEAHSIRALLLVEQYVSLRNEIEKRIEIRQQILALTLLVAGTFLTVGVQPNVPEVVLLFYPIIAMFLAAIWEHNDLRVGQLNFYLRTEVERHLGRFGPGWETFRLQTFLPRHRQRKGQRMGQAHPLTPQLGLIAFATRGMFLTTQAMAIVVAAVRYSFVLLQHGLASSLMGPKQVGISVAIVLLFLVDIGVLIYTRYLVQHKRI
jgi:hypothetical protein